MITKKPNYEKKADILNNNVDLLKFEKQLHKAVYKVEHLKQQKEEVFIYQDFENGEVLPYDDACKKYHDNLEIMKECHRINISTSKRTNRIRQKIKKYINLASNSKELKVHFLTLTFTDETLAATSEKTRKTYVSRWLKKNGIEYVANIDFGEKNDREHYHAVVLDNGQMNFKEWHKYGAIDSELVRYNKTSDVKLAKYVSKLTNHAIKETTKRNCYIYSR